MLSISDETEKSTVNSEKTDQKTQEKEGTKPTNEKENANISTEPEIKLENYALSKCGAKIARHGSGENYNALIIKDNDVYMTTKCEEARKKEKVWFVIFGGLSVNISKHVFDVFLRNRRVAQSYFVRLDVYFYVKLYSLNFFIYVFD